MPPVRRLEIEDRELRISIQGPEVLVAKELLHVPGVGPPPDHLGRARPAASSRTGKAPPVSFIPPPAVPRERDHHRFFGIGSPTFERDHRPASESPRTRPPGRPLGPGPRGSSLSQVPQPRGLTRPRFPGLRTPHGTTGVDTLT